MLSGGLRLPWALMQDWMRFCCLSYDLHLLLTIFTYFLSHLFYPFKLQTQLCSWVICRSWRKTVADTCLFCLQNQYPNFPLRQPRGAQMFWILHLVPSLSYSLVRQDVEDFTNTFNCLPVRHRRYKIGCIAVLSQTSLSRLGGSCQHCVLAMSDTGTVYLRYPLG
jgi:hypothetical protein